ncbi:MAG: HDIG domain-containing protein [Armatimonadetes bacterium]|nr:HDIG domain-containing protein [Armatimonadota bacterium]
MPRRWRLAPVRPGRLLLGVLLVLAYTAVLSGDLFRAGIDWEEGQYAPRSIYADRTHEFVDEPATAKLRDAARASVARQYDVLPVETEADSKVAQLAEAADALAADAAFPTPAGQAVELQRRLIWLSLSPSLLRWFLEQPAAQRASLAARARATIKEVYSSREIRDDAPQDLASARADVRARLAGLPADEGGFLASLLSSPDVLKPNRRFNREETDDQRERAATAIEPVRRTISRGQLIIARGHRVTAEVLRDLEALGLVQAHGDYAALFSLTCLVLLVLVVLGAYLKFELPEVYYDNRRIILLNLLAGGALVLFRLLLWLKIAVPSIAHPAIFCGAATGMVVAVLLEYRIAMMLTGALGLFMGLLLPGAGLYVAFEAWLAGRAGAMALRHVRDRNDLARAGLLTALAGMLIAAIVQLPGTADVGSYQAQHLGIDLLFGFGWGLLAFLLAQGVIPLLERPFGCVTPFRLLELTNTSTPVLQMLKRRARGSFDASLTIGDMAADACEAIGADPLLARACGYHHDIGKMRHPTWFIENVFGGENVHNRLEPNMSAMAIKSHVDDGVEIAREYHLPQPIIDVIAQHHGTTMISFFYYQALERAAEGERVAEERFRYDGPKPQFKESGIIMLADGIEAAVRAAAGHGGMTERKLNEIIQSLIHKRLEDGQLDECDLTLRDLNTAAKAFAEFLRGMYHERIEYPAQVLRTRPRKGGQDGRSDGTRN